MTGAIPGQLPARILAVRVGRGGDLVMVTPALRMLLDAFPAAQLQVLTGAEGPRILHGFDPRLTHFLVEPRSFPASVLNRIGRPRALRREGYDRIYVFETNPRYQRMVAHAAPSVFALGPPFHHEHFSDRCLDVVEASLATPASRGWAALPVSDEARLAADAYLTAHGLARGDTLVGLHLTSSDSGKGVFADRRGLEHRQWPFDQAAELARRLVEHGRSRGRAIRPVIDVLPDERALLAPFLERAGDAVTVLSGPSDFERYKAVLARLSLLVTPNTGPMHVAAAVGTPVVALFSHWSPADCGPFAPPGRTRILRAEDMPRPTRGLAAIPASSVFEACLDFLP